MKGDGTWTNGTEDKRGGGSRWVLGLRHESSFTSPPKDLYSCGRKMKKVKFRKINMCYFINWGEEDSIRRGHTMDCWNLTLLCIPVVQRWTVTIRGNDTNYRVEYDKLQHAPWPEVRLCGGTQWLRVTCPAVTRVWVKSILVNNPSVSATIMEVSRRLLNLVQLWFRAENDLKKKHWHLLELEVVQVCVGRLLNHS